MNKTDNSQLSNTEMVTISRAEYEEKNARLAAQNERISRLENQVEVLMEALRLARHKQFGASSEKSEEPLMEQLSFLFNEAEVFVEVLAETVESDDSAFAEGASDFAQDGNECDDDEPVAKTISKNTSINTLVVS